MPQVNIKAINPQKAEARRKILQEIEDTLNDEQLEKLGKISKSSKARDFLDNSWGTLKMFLGI